MASEVEKVKKMSKPKVTLFPDHDPYCSDTGGVTPMSISGRMINERERAIGMTDAERAWRAQWLKDQILAHDEPVMPAGFYQKRFNVIRRFYRFPFQCFENALAKHMHWENAKCIRHAISNTGFMIVGIWMTYYYLKYNHGDWARKNGVHIFNNRYALYPGDEGFGQNIETPPPQEFADGGFKKSTLYK